MMNLHCTAVVATARTANVASIVRILNLQRILNSFIEPLLYELFLSLQDADLVKYNMFKLNRYLFHYPLHIN